MSISPAPVRLGYEQRANSSNETEFRSDYGEKGMANYLLLLYDDPSRRKA